METARDRMSMSKQGASVVMLAFALGACVENPPAAPASVSSRQSFVAAVGGVDFQVRVFERDGSIVERHGNATVGEAAGMAQSVRDLRLDSPTRTRVPVDPSSIAPTFGHALRTASRDGRPGVALRLPTRRIARRQVEGRTIEIFTVKPADPFARAAGMIVSINGRMSSVVEFEDSAARRPTTGRVIQFDSTGAVLVEMRVDFRDVTWQSKLSVIERQSLRQVAGRLLRGFENLVLPDVLHAQRVEDDPCAGTEQFLMGAIAAQAAAGIAAHAAALACTVALFTCPGFLAAEAAFVIASSLAIYASIEYDECRSLHPPCFEGGYMTNGSCLLPDSGGGGSGGGGSGGGGDGGSGGTGGTGGTGGGGGGYVSCHWDTWWTTENGVIVTHSAVVCI